MAGRRRAHGNGLLEIVHGLLHSGLENALAHVLVAGLMLVTGTTIDTRARAGLAGTLVGLLGMTWLDLLLLGTPVGLSALRSWRSTLPAFAAGFAPLVAWEIFSIVYYGVPFPNTAYAKLATGIPQHELSIQGLTYFLDSLDRDPVTLFVIAGGIAAALAAGRRALLPGLAVIAYLLYVWADWRRLHERPLLHAPLS